MIHIKPIYYKYQPINPLDINDKEPSHCIQIHSQECSKVVVHDPSYSKNKTKKTLGQKHKTSTAYDD